MGKEDSYAVFFSHKKKQKSLDFLARSFSLNFVKGGQKKSQKAKLSLCFSQPFQLRFSFFLSLRTWLDYVKQRTHFLSHLPVRLRLFFKGTSKERAFFHFGDTSPEKKGKGGPKGKEISNLN